MSAVFNWSSQLAWLQGEGVQPMPIDNDPFEIVVCYGTACFARGNSENLAILKKYVQSPGSNATLRLTGRLCQGQCMEGPNVKIRGKLHHGVTAARLRELLQLQGMQLGADHGAA
jgi:NADH:ubiquinone oxidoreductase subunit E